MNHNAIQYKLRQHMFCSESYDYKEMRSEYIKVRNEYIRNMTVDEANKHPLITKKTFENLISLWANSPDGWLIKKGRGVNARFYKRRGYIWRCHMSQDKLIKRVAKKIMSMTKLRSMRWRW